MDCIKDHWRFISRDCCLKEQKFIKAIQLVLDSTFFDIDNVIYKQNYGTSIDLLSPVIADLMQKLEVRTLFLIWFLLPFTIGLLTTYYWRNLQSSVSSILDF